jgi:hypothetical protein
LRLCPFCAEEIKEQAILCKHCHSSVEPVRPVSEMDQENTPVGFELENTGPNERDAKTVSTGNLPDGDHKENTVIPQKNEPKTDQRSQICPRCGRESSLKERLCPGCGMTLFGDLERKEGPDSGGPSFSSQSNLRWRDDIAEAEMKHKRATFKSIIGPVAVLAALVISIFISGLVMNQPNSKENQTYGGYTPPAVSSQKTATEVYTPAPVKKLGPASTDILGRLREQGAMEWQDSWQPYPGYGPSPTYLFTTTDPNDYACSVYVYKDPNLQSYDLDMGNFPTDNRQYWWFEDSKSGYSIVIEAGSIDSECGLGVQATFSDMTF